MKKYKAFLTGVFVSLFFNQIIVAQVDSTVASIRMNFAVPDAPAFKILGIQPDNILRPATTQELAISLSEPFLSSKFPSAVAMEFSPYLTIAGSSLTLRNYQESSIKRILYRTRISVASRRSTSIGDTTILAFGLRFTLLDESDLRLDKDYIDKIYSYNDSILALESRIRDHFRDTIPPFAINVKEAQDSIAIATRELDSKIAAVREEAKLRNWNKSIIEAGIAIAGASPESTRARGIVGTRAAFWFVGAGSFSTWGQWVLGLNTTLRRNSAGKFSAIDGALSGRIYAGENIYKGYVQFESEIQDHELKNLLLIGGEARLFGTFWIDYAAGIQKAGSNPVTFTSNLNVRMGTPWN
jgi:hypothetical protein